MALYENGQLTKPIGSAVQVETLPELPPQDLFETNGAYAARVAAWGARTRTITFTTEDGSLMGIRETTAPLRLDATAAEIETALLAGTVLSTGDVEVVGTGRKFTYSFGGAVYSNKKIKEMYSTLDNGIKIYFETIQEGVSLAGQAEVRRVHTEDALGINAESFLNERREPAYDIGDPRRYNADGTIKESQKQR